VLVGGSRFSLGMDTLLAGTYFDMSGRVGGSG